MSWRLPPSRLHALSDLYAEPTSVAALALCFNGFHHARTGFESERIMNRISLKGIAIGAITDIVSSYIVLLPSMIYVMVTLNSSGLPSDKAAGAAMEALSSNTLFIFSCPGFWVECARRSAAMFQQGSRSMTKY
jgi:hypothetical protein